MAIHEKVREFLEQERHKRAAAEGREREEALLRLGLWEKEYEPETGDDFSQYTETDEDGRRWRKAPIPVTEEEWAEIRRYAGKDRVSKWSVALWIFGGIFYGAAAYAFFDGAGLFSALVWAAGGTLLSAVGKCMDPLYRR